MQCPAGRRRPAAGLPGGNVPAYPARSATAQLLATEMGESPAAFVTYDKRLLAAATAAGLPTASPGAVS